MKTFIIPMLVAVQLLVSGICDARSIYAPWETASGFESLVYGSSSTVDVAHVMGAPDDIVRTEQIFPVVENYYYNDEEGSGAASVFVFENGLLVGLYFQSASRQYMDLTYFLTNNGDRMMNWSMNEGYRSYAPWFPLYGHGF